MLDHGGNLDQAAWRFGGRLEEWIDLSTGINRIPFPVPELALRHWTALPSRSDVETLQDAARQAYATPAKVLALSGAQAAIQLLPHWLPRGDARLLSPTYNEYGAVLRAAGWRVREVADLEALAGADLAIIVNPNNPDGRACAPAALLTLLPRIGRLVVDESFADAMPGFSLAPEAGRAGFLILRSLGKFYGLAGVRLGFVLGVEADVATLAQLAGPWPVSGPAIAIGVRALSDRAWAAATIARLAEEAPRLDGMALKAGWSLLGGTPLFRLYEVGDAAAAQDKLARKKIWSRIFVERPGWLRLGLPGDEAEWVRLAAALSR
jgi:cobalamin biosynthetic protein CobC